MSSSGFGAEISIRSVSKFGNRFAPILFDFGGNEDKTMAVEKKSLINRREPGKKAVAQGSRPVKKATNPSLKLAAPTTTNAPGALNHNQTAQGALNHNQTMV